MPRKMGPAHVTAVVPGLREHWGQTGWCSQGKRQHLVFVSVVVSVTRHLTGCHSALRLRSGDQGSASGSDARLSPCVHTRVHGWR